MVVVVVVAVGTMDVKKKERKKLPFLSVYFPSARRSRVRTPTHPRSGGGRWHYGCQERKKEKKTPLFFLSPPSARTDHASRHQHIRVVVVAVGHCGCQEEREKKKKKPTFYLCGWVVVNADRRTVAVVAIYARGGVAVAFGAADVKKKEEKKKKPHQEVLVVNAVVVVMVDVDWRWPTCGGGGERERERTERRREREREREREVGVCYRNKQCTRPA